MTLYVIARGKGSFVSEQLQMLRQAARARGVYLEEVFADVVDMTAPPVLEAGDMLYRDAGGERAINIERILVNEQVATFHRSVASVFAYRSSSYFPNYRDGLPVIPTYSGYPNSDEELERVIEKLGGFPLIVKVRGGMKGVGVIRTDSLPALRSLLDYLQSERALVFIRAYVDHEYYGRLIVVGDQVVASNRTFVPQTEFRSNTVANTDANREPYVFSPEVVAAAVAAVRSCGLEFGGVDILFDKKGSFYIAEVNFPCQFGTAARLTGIDVAGVMIDYLSAKAARLL